ncbi:Ltp family lipoprotein [Mammaliicoccus sciuri]
MVSCTGTLLDSFSRNGLIDQLKYEGFSGEQATNAVNEIGL